ncbi:MAG TPA: hypothetical protein VKB34_19190 [Povalibacter sp.]|nr:hypothetical protein [Povalibacter sp.]
MNQWRIAGLILAAVFAAWLTLRGCSPEEEDRPAPAPVRDQFHASKPLAVVAAYATAAGNQADLAWLERELRYLLMRGQMRIAAQQPGSQPIYTLRVELDHAPPTAATLRLLAPDGVVERTLQVQLGEPALATMRSLAGALPAFLGAAHTTTDWATLLGTDDSSAYENFLRSSNELLDANGRGFTRPGAAANSATVDRLEALTRRHPRFARAWSLLSVAYLNLGGKDQASLTQLADTTAERALGLDPALTDAQSAQGLARLRRGEWTAALEHFNTALKVDANSSPALEGLACLLVDVGHSTAALPIAQRAVALQPGSIGANECLVYAQLGTATDVPPPAKQSEPLAVAQVRALNALLSARPAEAEGFLRAASNTSNASQWVDPLLRAATNRQQTSEALQAITRAASDNVIDPVTEVISGAALRQSDFVFNRMLRLHKQHEQLPLRILWLPDTAFLRQHRRFAEIVTAAGLPAFWQDHGLPDICAHEPAVFGCKLKSQPAAKSPD